MNNTYKLFFELIQVAIGSRESLSSVPFAEEWNAIYRMAVKQAVAGVCFYGVQLLPKEQIEAMPKKMMVQWLALAEVIRRKNVLMNIRCVELQRMLMDEGIFSSILKGQGAACYYRINNPDIGFKNDSFPWAI